jgi:hypothetical protein
MSGIADGQLDQASVTMYAEVEEDLWKNSAKGYNLPLFESSRGLLSFEICGNKRSAWLVQRSYVMLILSKTATNVLKGWRHWKELVGADPLQNSLTYGNHRKT